MKKSEDIMDSVIALIPFPVIHEQSIYYWIIFKNEFNWNCLSICALKSIHS